LNGDSSPVGIQVALTNPGTLGRMEQGANAIPQQSWFTKTNLERKDVMEASMQVDGRRLKDAVRAFEREYIMLRLKENRFDKRKTAEELHIALSSLYRKLSELHIGEQQQS
jgi:DNA-binding NtrC family response regulator